jgi:hypothetical protein
MRRLLSLSTLGLASLVAVGLLSLQGGTAAADDLVKRDEDTPDIVLTHGGDDDDDADDTDEATSTNSGTNSVEGDATGNTNSLTSDNTGTNTGTDTGDSNSTSDETRSRFTSVSRDRDLSRGDKTTDMTNDGPGRKNVDHSKNQTNDKSRNDTRR